MSELVNLLSTLSLIWFFITLVVSISVFGYRAVVYGLSFGFREKRLFNNLKKKIIVLAVGEDLEREIMLLKRVGFFKVETVAYDFEMLNHKQHSTGLAILQFKSGREDDFDRIFSKLREKELPVIVITHDEISKEKYREITSYSYVSVANSPLRLTGDAFTILATFNHEQE